MVMVYVPFVLVAIAWCCEHRECVVEVYIRNGGSVKTIQQAIRIWFQHTIRHKKNTMLKTGLL